MYSVEARKKYAELIKTATESLAPLFNIELPKEEEPTKEF